MESVKSGNFEIIQLRKCVTRKTKTKMIKENPDSSFRICCDSFDHFEAKTSSQQAQQHLLQKTTSRRDKQNQFSNNYNNNNNQLNNVSTAKIRLPRSSSPLLLASYYHYDIGNMFTAIFRRQRSSSPRLRATIYLLSKSSLLLLLSLSLLLLLSSVAAVDPVTGRQLSPSMNGNARSRDESYGQMVSLNAHAPNHHHVYHHPHRHYLTKRSSGEIAPQNTDVLSHSRLLSPSLSPQLSSQPPPQPDNNVEIKTLSSEANNNQPNEQQQHVSRGNPAYNYYVTSNAHNKKAEHEAPTRYQVAKFDFEHVSTPYIISMWIIIVGLAKIGFHVTPKLSSICPESVVLMVLGVAIGLIMYFAGIPEDRLQPLTPNLFFLYMLPPIVMDAGYHMPNRLFFDNLFTILLYAVVGTIWNALAIGLSLYGCSRLGAFGDEIPFLDIMLFSSTVSAVDPVAVLAVFEEIHVNEVLYILVFGESLLNDAVTVVLYHMFEGYAEIAYHHGIESIRAIDYFAGFASFFVVALGGTAMGVFWGFLAAFVSRFTHHVKIIEPIFVFVMAYLSYLSAEMFHLSGILSLTFCGITMKNYVEENITQKSHTTLKYAMKMLANSSEAIIFVFLGVCTVNDQHRWNTAFVTLTIVFCLVYRSIGVIVLTALTNRFRLHRVNRVEQFIMSYGGLRGAVAFALILIINRQIIHAREMFVTTIIAVVYFTVFLQGMTVGALVKILNVERANKFQLSMNERIHTRLMDHAMAGLEDISGIMMMGNYKMRDKFRRYNNRYLRKWLLRDAGEMGNSSRKIFETCSRLDLQDAMSLVSKQHLMYTTLNNTLANGGNGGPGAIQSSNLLSVNRYLYDCNNTNHNNTMMMMMIGDDDDDDEKIGSSSHSSSSSSSFSSPSPLPRTYIIFAPPTTKYRNRENRNPDPNNHNNNNNRSGGGYNNNDYDDNKNNKNNHNNNNNDLPSIFLTVPSGGGGGGANFPRTFETVPFQTYGTDEDGDLAVDPTNRTLTAILRSFTKSDLTDLTERNEPRRRGGDDARSSAMNGTIAAVPPLSLPLPASTNVAMDKDDFNYDIGNISYSPSLKDLSDAELHHVLSEAMFKPFKHVNHYTRSDYSEPPPVHPPFQHQVRMQIRKMISENKKSRHRRSGGAGGGTGDNQDLIPNNTGGSGGTVGNTRNKIDKRKKFSQNLDSSTGDHNDDGNRTNDAKMKLHDTSHYSVIADSIVIANEAAKHKPNFDNDNIDDLDDDDDDDQDEDDANIIRKHHKQDKKQKSTSDMMEMTDRGKSQKKGMKKSFQKIDKDFAASSARTSSSLNRENVHHDDDDDDDDDDEEGGIVFTAKHRRSEVEEGPKISDDLSTISHQSQDIFDNDNIGDGDDRNDNAFSDDINRTLTQFGFPWRRPAEDEDPNSRLVISTTTPTSADDTRSSTSSTFGRLDNSRTSTSSRSSGEEAGEHRKNRPNRESHQSQPPNSHSHHHHHRHKSNKHQNADSKGLKDGVVRQREFPSWIENRDYVADYASPTNTLLERISSDHQFSNGNGASGSGSASGVDHQQQPPQAKTIPSVYEIFQLNKNENVDKNTGGGARDSRIPPPTKSKGEMATIIETTFPASNVIAPRSSNSRQDDRSRSMAPTDEEDQLPKISHNDDRKKDDNDNDDNDDDDENDYSIIISKL